VVVVVVAAAAAAAAVVVCFQQKTATLGDTETQRHRGTETQTHTEVSWAIGNDPFLYAHMPLPVLRSHTPGAAPDPRLKSGPVFVASGDVIIILQCQVLEKEASAQTYRYPWCAPPCTVTSEFLPALLIK